MFRKQGYRFLRFKNVAVSVALKEEERKDGKTWFFFSIWTGKSILPKGRHLHTYTTSEKHREWAIKNAVETARSNEEARAKRAREKASVKAADFWSVGDVIYNSWGYDQTNIDWYQIVEVKNKSVVLREIAQNCSDFGGPTGGKTQPCRNQFCGKPFVKMVGREGRISFEFGGSSKWDGKPKYCSSYH